MKLKTGRIGFRKQICRAFRRQHFIRVLRRAQYSSYRPVQHTFAFRMVQLEREWKSRIEYFEDTGVDVAQSHPALRTL